VASQPRVPVACAVARILIGCEIEAAFKRGRSRWLTQCFVTKRGGVAAPIVGVVSRTRCALRIESEQGPAPVQAVRHSLGPRPRTVTHPQRKCLAQPPVGEVCWRRSWFPRRVGTKVRAQVSWTGDVESGRQRPRRSQDRSLRGCQQRKSPTLPGGACSYRRVRRGNRRQLSVFRSSSIELARETPMAFRTE
jgi:hypothetical protein